VKRSLLLAALLAAVPLPAASAPITFVSQCADVYFRQVATGLEVRCRSTGTSVPAWITIGGCLKATAALDPFTQTYKVTCGPGSFAQPVTQIQVKR